ncbi:hypothetical protein [Burkholderia sp. BCC1644]|uniref:hypothetical protein n=1 Tax=Burkholderia sp. BCC1644 TaxID=2676293 RepID=UPI001590583C|nr:hypothetical protein [Burkholderia sp. BCC1644]
MVASGLRAMLGILAFFDYADMAIAGVVHECVVWPKRRFVPARVRRVTECFARALPQCV